MAAERTTHLTAEPNALTRPERQRWIWTFGAILAALVVFTFLAKFPLYLGVKPDTITDNRLRTDNPSGKDYWHYFVAAEAMQQGYDIYDSGIKYYIYPPLTAMLIMPLLPLGWMLGSQVFLAASLLMVLAAAWLLWRDLGARFGGQASRDRLIMLGMIALAFAAVCEPARRTFSMIQTDPIILLALVLGLRLARPRPMLAGAILGLAVNIKYHTIILLPYFLLRRQWRAAASFAASAAACAIAPALVVGWERNLGYWRRAVAELGFAAGVNDTARSGTYPLAWEGSIAIPSAIARAAEAIGLDAAAQRPVVAVAVVGLAGLCAAAVWWIYRRHGAALFSHASRLRDPRTAPGGRLEAVEWAGLITATLVFSPQTTKRHMLTLMVLGAIAAAILLLPQGTASPAIAPEVERRRRWVLIGLIAVIASMYLPPRMNGLRWASDLWNACSGVSWCVAALLLLVVWAAVGRAEPSDRAARA